MSEANVELIRAVYERFAGGDQEEALELIDPAFELHDRPEIPDPQVYRGHEGVIASLQVSQDTFDELSLVPEEYVDAGDRVAVVFRFRGTGRGSGMEVDEQLVHLWTIRDGKAVRMDVKSSLEEALRAAGVR
jgi:ketosteroid isomerase-like protein